ncbi:hypothetical protein PPUN109347_40720 [Pseudomonas putida]|nr:hypothetical protein PPUN109347_40720 [Pseudomonas putida]
MRMSQYDRYGKCHSRPRSAPTTEYLRSEVRRFRNEKGDLYAQDLSLRVKYILNVREFREF